MNLTPQHEVELYHSTYFNPETAKKYLQKIARTMYTECNKAQKYICGIERFDGNMSAFINNKKICYDQNISSDHYILTIPGDTINYFLKKQFLRNYKNKVFSLEEVNGMNSLFERRIWLFIDGFFIPNAYIIEKPGLVYFCLKESDFDNKILKELVTNDKPFTILFLPHTNTIRGDNKLTSDFYINDNINPNAASFNNLNLPNSPFWTAFDNSIMSKKNMLCGTDLITYKSENDSINYTLETNFVKYQKENRAKVNFFAFNDFNLLSHHSLIDNNNIFKNYILNKDYWTASEENSICFNDEFVILKGKNKDINFSFNCPEDVIPLNMNGYLIVSIYKNTLNGNGDLHINNVYNMKCNRNNDSMAFEFKTGDTIKFPILSLKLPKGFIDGEIYLKIELIDKTNYSSLCYDIDTPEDEPTGKLKLCVPLEDTPISPNNFFIYAYDKSTKAKWFLHEATITHHYPNIFVIENIPKSVTCVNVEYYEKENKEYDIYIPHKWYIDMISETSYMDMYFDGTLPDLLKNYIPKVFDYSFTNFQSIATDSTDKEEFDNYLWEKLKYFLTENPNLYLEMLEELYRNEFMHISKTMYVDLEDSTWSYIYDRATATTSAYNEDGNLVNPELMRSTNITLSEDYIFIKVSDSDDSINDFAIWVDTLRILDYRVFVENFTTWIFIPKRLVTNTSIIEIEMFMKSNRKECKVIFNDIDETFPLCSNNSGGFQEAYPPLKTIGNSSDVVNNDKIFRYVVSRKLNSSNNWVLITEGENANTLLFYNKELLLLNNPANDVTDIESSVFPTRNIISLIADDSLGEGIYGESNDFWENNPDIKEGLSKYGVGNRNYGIFLRINKDRLLSSDIEGFLSFLENSNIDKNVFYGSIEPNKETRYTKNCMCDNFIPNNLLFFDKETKEIFPQNSFYIIFNKNKLPLNILTHRVNGLECRLGINDPNLIGRHISFVTIDNYFRVQKNNVNAQGTSRFIIEDFEGFYGTDQHRTRFFIDGRKLYEDMTNITSNRKTNIYKDKFESTGAINSNKPNVGAALEYIPYGLKIIYSNPILAPNGVIDLVGFINKPFSLLYYDVYVNGRKLTPKHIDIICGDMIRLKKINSLKHVRIYEKIPLGDTYHIYPSNENHDDANPSLESDFFHIDNNYKLLFPDEIIPDEDDPVFDNIDLIIKEEIDIIEEVIFKLPIFPDVNQLKDRYLTLTENHLEPGTNVYMVNPDRFFNNITGESSISKVYHYNPDNDVNK